MFSYPAAIKKDANGSYLVTFPDVPEAITYGDSLAEASDHAVEALETALSFYIDAGKPLPSPGKIKRPHIAIEPTMTGMLKLAIYQSMREGGVRKSDLARKMGCHLMQIDRLLDLTHASTLAQLEAALAALSRKVHMDLVAA